jgi:hypothetical protein
MKVTLLLADSAQAVAGKLYVLGGGWSVIGPGPAPMAIAAKIEVPWDQANTKHELLLELLDADGQPVTPEDEENPIRIGGQFEVGRPPGVKPGTPIDFPFAVQIGPLPLEPDSRYEWRLTIDGKGADDWRLSFTTRPLQRAIGGQQLAM